MQESEWARNAGRTRYPIAALRAAGLTPGFPIPDRILRFHQTRGGGGFSTGVFLIGIRRDRSDQRACDAAASPPEPGASPAICDRAGAADARKRFESLGLRDRNGRRLWCGVRARRRMRHRRRGFNDWLKSFKQVAINNGVSREVVDAALGGITYDPSVKAHDHGVAAFGSNFASFAASHASPGMIARGKSLLQRYAEPLAKIEQRFGVPGPVLSPSGVSKPVLAPTTERFRRSPLSPHWPMIAAARSGIAPS